jgi:hypothetical protein
MPPVRGEVTSREPHAAVAPFADGVSSREGKTVVDFGRFFEGSQVSLYIVVKRTG